MCSSTQFKRVLKRRKRCQLSGAQSVRKQYIGPTSNNNRPADLGGSRKFWRGVTVEIEVWVTGKCAVRTEKEARERDEQIDRRLDGQMRRRRTVEAVGLMS